MPISVDTQGLGNALDMMRELQAISKVQRGAELKAKQRLATGDFVSARSGDANNAQIAEWLSDDGRDFFSLPDRDAELLAAEFAAEVEKRMAALAARRSRDSLSIKDLSSKEATTTATAGLRRMMVRWCKIITERINMQRTASGSGPQPVDAEYAQQRQRDYSVSTDRVGIATGQLLENFAHPGAAIRITKL